MTTLLTKHSTFIILSLLVALLALAWVFPAQGLLLGILFLALCFSIAGLAVLHRHRQAYRLGKITRAAFIRSAALDLTGTWLAMLVAALVGNAVARIVTQPIGHDVGRLLAGVAVALVVGLVVGALARKTWGRLVMWGQPPG
jgi:hypothetical protein